MSESEENKCVVISTGNTDNRLTQQQWSSMVHEMDLLIQEVAVQVHFFGGPSNYAPWQNAAWIAELDAAGAEIKTLELRSELVKIRERYKQDSVMIMFAKPHFV